MLNTAQTQTFCQCKASGIRFFLSVVVVFPCLLAMGCASSDKSKSFWPFYGGGTSVNPPENEFSAASPPMSPAPPVTVSDGPGPATPSDPVSSAVTSNSPNPYNPPDMLPARSASPAPTYARDNRTEVYDIPPGTRTNSGASAGVLPNPFYDSGSSTGLGGTTSSGQGGDSGRPSTPRNGSDSGRAVPNDGTSNSKNDTNSSGRSSYDGVDYGGSTTDNRYDPGPSTGYRSSLMPTDSRLEDGDYLAGDGSMKRVIHGKVYELVQYIPRTPPILSDLSGEAQPRLSAQPQFPQTSTQIQISTDYRSATQMTESFRQVPIPEYGSLLDQQANGLHVLSQGMITVSAPTTTTIIPDSVPVETVPSLDYSDYAEIGAIKVPSTRNHGPIGEVDEEMQSSIWSIMAKQNHDLLLFPQKTK